MVYHVFIFLFDILLLRWFSVAKIRLFINSRKQGSYIASIPLKQLVKLSGYDDRHRRWSYVDGWLILEAF